MFSKIKYIFESLKEYTYKTNKRTGKKKIFIFLDMIWCGIRYGASPKNYYMMSFANLSSKQRKTFVTSRMNIKLQKKCNQEEYVHFFRNKVDFYSKFKDFMGRKVVNSKDIKSVEELQKIGKKIIVKPICGAQGQNIKVFELDGKNDNAIFNIIKNLGESSVETFLEQHEEMNKFCSVAVNVVRVATGRTKNGFRVLTSVAAVSRKEPVANGSCDALMLNVDSDKGEFSSAGLDLATNKLYETHPISKKQFKGFKIPYWKETIEMLEEASKVVPEVGYVGWDVAITPTGPVIIEGNNDGGYDALQLLQLEQSGIGKKKEYSFLLKK